MSLFRTPLKPGNPDESDFLGFDNASSETSANTALKPVELASTVKDDADLVKQIKSLARQREQAMNKLLRIYKDVSTRLPIELSMLKGFASRLQAVYSEYSKFHSEIIAVLPDEELESQENEYIRFEKHFDFTSAAVETRIMQKSVPSAAPPAQVVIHQQPLKAPIPSFDGEYVKWPKFKAMFLDVMAQSRDSDAIKLYHLDKAMVGAAEGFLDQKTLNEGNYA